MRRVRSSLPDWAALARHWAVNLRRSSVANTAWFSWLPYNSGLRAFWRRPPEYKSRLPAHYGAICAWPSGWLKLQAHPILVFRLAGEFDNQVSIFGHKNLFFCHCEIRLYRRKAVFEDEITLYNEGMSPCSRDRHRTGAREPICEIGSVQAEKKDWWLCRGSAKTPLSRVEKARAWLAWRRKPIESEIGNP